MPLIPPPVLALTAGVLQRVLAPDTRTGPVRASAAAIVAAGSLGLMAAAASGFRRAGTTVEPFDPRRATALVTTGANSVTRNPMYVGMAGVITAHAMVRGSALAFLPVAGFVAAVDRLQIAPEEAALSELFGDDYAAYRQRVPRWLGRPAPVQ